MDARVKPVHDERGTAPSAALGDANVVRTHARQ
jgi:hypothetical protein